MTDTFRSTQPDIPPSSASLIDETSIPGRRLVLRALRAGAGIELAVVDTDNRSGTPYKAVEIRATGVPPAVEQWWHEPVLARDNTWLDTISFTYNPGNEPNGPVWTNVSSLTLDGVAIPDGGRVLIMTTLNKDEGHGIFVYNAAAAALYRAEDLNDPSKFLKGKQVLVLGGTHFASTSWYYAGPDNPTLGSTDIVFAESPKSSRANVNPGPGLGIQPGPNFTDLLSIDFSTLDQVNSVADTDLLAVKTASGHRAITRANFLGATDIPFPANVGVIWPGGAQIYEDQFNVLQIRTPNTIFFSSNEHIFTDSTGTAPPVVLRPAHPTQSIAVFPGTGAITLPNGQTTYRISSSPGELRLNTDTGRLELYDGGTWHEFPALDDWFYAEVTYSGTNPISGFFSSPPFSKDTTFVYVEDKALRNSQFDIVNGTDLQIIGFPVSNGDVVWAKYLR